MKCPFCTIHIHQNWSEGDIYRASYALQWRYRTAQCPECHNLIVEIHEPDGDIFWRRIHPVGANRGPVPKQVPPTISEDYIEACNVLPLSNKASAALSRRCLQEILHAHGYKAKNLAEEIDLVLNESDPKKAIPQSLHNTIDGIRHFGNFSAHPINDKTSLQVIDVNPEEAEWCLEIIEEMFQHFYVKPAEAQAKKDALNAKLAAAGKPPAK